MEVESAPVSQPQPVKKAPAKKRRQLKQVKPLDIEHPVKVEPTQSETDTTTGTNSQDSDQQGGLSKSRKRTSQSVEAEDPPKTRYGLRSKVVDSSTTKTPVKRRRK
ncbi:hypothetical protein GEMRC1_012683 [Eukaryota sp. GEM-RC1]